MAVHRLFAALAIAAACSAQPKEPCFAFLMKGDITAVCQGKTTQITHRGDVEHFAVSDEQAALAYISGGAGTATVINLKTAAVKRVSNVDEVVASCGGILPIPVGGSNTLHEVVTGAELTFAPYRRFRCSADRKTVVGMTSRELYEGLPPSTKIAPGTEVHDLYFNISPDGSKVAYFNDVKPLCIVSSPGAAKCVEHETMSDPVSVNDAGEVLAASGTGKGCVYKSAFNFTPAKTPDSGDDECLGVGYWKPGTPAIVFLQDIGRNPQWLRPETAALLVEWSRHR
ncbi:MAG TPA: hypothetical protein VG456_19315 [Candidatus Sulfopaludibacter sp.]|jgi:hypothetical protein|nr:hypothetical protein [Candidatus Sulfopaludibacter sp.]